MATFRVLPLRYRCLKVVKNPIGDRIRREREKIGLSQSDLAHDVGISQKALSQIETGKVDPRRPTLAAIEDKLNLRRGELYGQDVNYKPSPYQMKLLITEERESVPYAALALVLERFVRESPEVRAAVLKVLYGDKTISHRDA